MRRRRSISVKLVIAAGFFVYLIEFARSAATRRHVNRETLDVVLILAVVGIVIWALPAMALGDGALIQLYATQLLLVVGAIIVVTVERHLETPEQALTRVETVAAEKAAAQAAVMGGELRGARVPAYTTRRLQG
jgi:undecaprenyl pyrophosphate phosphatase UppP